MPPRVLVAFPASRPVSRTLVACPRAVLFPVFRSLPASRRVSAFRSRGETRLRRMSEGTPAASRAHLLVTCISSCGRRVDRPRDAPTTALTQDSSPSTPDMPLIGRGHRNGAAPILHSMRRPTRYEVVERADIPTKRGCPHVTHLLPTPRYPGQHEAQRRDREETRTRRGHMTHDSPWEALLSSRRVVTKQRPPRRRLLRRRLPPPSSSLEPRLCPTHLRSSSGRPSAMPSVPTTPSGTRRWRPTR